MNSVKMPVIQYKLIFFLCFIYSAAVLAAPAAIYHFNSLAEQQRFTTLTRSARCLVCQNQSLADSDAPLATDLRNEIYALVKQGKDNAAIEAFLRERYGAYVLLRPPFNQKTWLLWVTPFLLLLIGLVGVVRYARRSSSALN